MSLVLQITCDYNRVALCTIIFDFRWRKVDLRRFRKQILRSMSDSLFDREKFALQRVLHELLPNLGVHPRISRREFSEKHVIFARFFSSFYVEKT